MVKIVGREKNVIKRATCKNCGAILEYYPKEVKSYTYKDYGGGSDTVYYIKCPDCTEKVVVK